MTTTAPVQFELDSLPETLRGLLPQPYEAYRAMLSATALETVRDRRARQMMEAGSACTAVLRDERTIEGFACWTWLKWDSEQFGFPAARLELLVAEGDYYESRRRKSVLIDLIEAQCADAGIRHLTARVGAGDFATVHALERAGFELIDGIQTFSLDLNSIPAGPAPASTGIELRLFRNRDLEQVLAIARSAYIFDRFHADAALDREVADQVNETWVANSCRGTAADAVVVACQGDRILGYVTCKIDHDSAALLGTSFGTIVMVATDPRAQGSGVAKAATRAALDWFRSQGVRIVEVGTQLRNVPAGRLYESCGFRLVSVNLTFRKVL
ncbi:MAG TPA: GNAT family N-acetyltransferase [Bryobacteraceae bacterium]|nr:GNAT family N-acetyltransferase [Bryobacteraceae bacterium]